MINMFQTIKPLQKQRKKKDRRKFKSKKSSKSKNNSKKIEKININTEYGTITLKDFAERLIQDGYIFKSINDYGGYEIRKGTESYTSKDFKNKDVRQYLRNYFRDLQKAENAQQEKSRPRRI